MLPDYQSVSGVGLGAGPFGNLNIATAQFTSPAVGADFTLKVPDTGEMWQLVAIHASLATSAAAANRIVNLTVKDHAGVIVYEFSITTAITAGLTIPITFTPQVASVSGDITAAKRFLFPVPAGPYLPGWTFNSVTTAIDTGDQWGQLAAWFIADQPL